MHNISKQALQELAAQIVELCLHSDNEKILEKTRALYEMSIIFYHNQKIKETDNETIRESVVEKIETPSLIDAEPEFLIEFEEPEIETPSTIEFTFEEHINEIMENNEKNEVQTKINFPVKDDIPTEVKLETAEEIIKSSEPLKEIKKSMPTVSREEEMSHSIPADIAADMFERLDKSNSPKKSLNDVLSQEQIQIGLNDKIAFVKHLFDGNLADFNRVLSQLNSFETESQAKDFLINIVKVDYNWAEKAEYEQRLIQLVERKFL